ncbi:larval cuticle protein 1-like [Anticarsia gemmatalis]|uniref:larval cuticle protein 1-like n=1 Tax=Anticarsia gemmatalis TaxID=129554 RepID=UPI003F769AF0
MKSIILVAFAVAAIAVAAPVSDEAPKVEVVEYKNEQSEEGYSFGFLTSDGVNRKETGKVEEVLNEENKPQKVVVVRGSYTYLNSDGQTETITYVADETGFHAEGPAIPVAPSAEGSR